MNLFVQTEDFKNMNVGFALDEGMFLKFIIYILLPIFTLVCHYTQAPETPYMFRKSSI